VTFSVGIPFVHQFEVAGDSYVYDVNTNQILAVQPVLAAVLRRYGRQTRERIIGELGPRFAPDQVVEAMKEVEEGRHRDELFLPRQVRLVLPEPANPAEGKLRHLVLTVTERCNLRCAYCMFGADLDRVRPHGHADMDPELGKRAIRFFLDRADPDREPVVSFYGGEPLLVPELLQELVAEIRSHRRGPETTISIDTNGVRLTGEVIEFLVREKAYLQISLDGPGAVHDRHRTEAGGRGSFRRIMRGLDRLLDRDASFAERLSFMVTLTPETDLAAVRAFFAEFLPFTSRGITVEPRLRVNRADLDGQDWPGESEGWRRLAGQVGSAREAYLAGLRSGQRKRIDPVVRALFEPALIRLYLRPDSRLGEEFRPGANCRLGVRKLHVGLDGQFRPCERMNESGVVGGLGRGIEELRVQQLREEFHDAVLPGCRECWALRLCGICYAAQARADRLGADSLEQDCRRVRKSREEELSLLVEVLQMPAEGKDWLETTALD